VNARKEEGNMRHAAQADGWDLGDELRDDAGAEILYRLSPSAVCMALAGLAMYLFFRRGGWFN